MLIVKSGMVLKPPINVPPPPCGRPPCRVLPWRYDAGGWTGAPVDNPCVGKAVSIATGVDRATVDRAIDKLHREMRGTPAGRGVPSAVVSAYLETLGWRYTKLREQDGACVLHLDELPSVGAFVVWLAPHPALPGQSHLTALVDGTIVDTFSSADPRFNMPACVVGYWSNTNA